jgi:DNA repair protein RadD
MDGSLPPVTLRPYQECAVADIRASMRQHRRVLFCLPTGGGKTVIFSYLTGEVSRKEKRVIIVAHRIEIVRQISKALTRQGIPHGLIVSGQPWSSHPVKVAMVQTLCNKVECVEEPHILICDEAHHAVAGSWDKIKQAWPNAFHLGVTATPQRLDGKGLGHAFDTLVLGPNPKELIDLGNLADYEYLAPPSNLDLSEVHTRAGDYAIDELKEAVEKSTILGDAIIHYRRYLDGKPALVFCINVAHAQDVAARFLAAGIPAAAVDGKMKQGDRDSVLSGLEDGRIKVVCSCDLISEGFDVPEVAGCQLLRPTQSLTLFLQQVGRALRPKADGSRAVILDHVGNYEIHGFPDDIRSWSLEGRPKQKRDAAPSVTACQLCFRVMHAPVIHSPDFPCGGRDGEVCPYREVSPGREIEEVDGDLVDAKAARDARPVLTSPAWAGGLILETAKGRDWFRLLDLAGTDAMLLEEIRVARGYKRGWVGHQIVKRRHLEDNASEIIKCGRLHANGASYILDRLLGMIGGNTDDVLWLVYRTLKANINAPGYANGDRTTLSYVHGELNKRKQKAA